MSTESGDSIAYEQQLSEKTAHLQQLLSPYFNGQLDVFKSPESGYRMRAEFKIWHDDDGASYAMYRAGEYKKPYKIDGFSAGSDTISQLMPPLLSAINQSPILKSKLFQVEFLSTLTKECVITLIYHKPLGTEWQSEAEQLETALGANIIGRSRKQKVVLSKDYVTERLTVGDIAYRYRQVETGFTQPNAVVCEQMLQWAVQQSAELGGDLLELYCGNGNFTLPLASQFERVLATEIAKISVNSAHWNLQENGVSNVTIVRMSSEEITSALNGERPFRRLKEIDLESYQFSTVFVDPPRAGLDPATLKLIERFDNILYVSCNPATLTDNLRYLSNTHRVASAALFDQFPFTDHIEAGVLLRKN